MRPAGVADPEREAAEAESAGERGRDGAQQARAARRRRRLAPAAQRGGVEARAHVLAEQRQVLAQVEPLAQLGDRLLARAHDVRAAAGASSHAASCSSPSRVRAAQSSSKSEPRPKRSRSSA